MKKFLFILILMLCFGLVLVSCKKNDSPESDSTTTTESTHTTVAPTDETHTDDPSNPSQGATSEEPYVQNPEVNSSPYGDGDQGIGSDWSENY